MCWNCFAKKLQSQIVIRENFWKALSYKKVTSKMLMKLTPALEWVVWTKICFFDLWLFIYSWQKMSPFFCSSVLMLPIFYPPPFPCKMFHLLFLSFINIRLIAFDIKEMKIYDVFHVSSKRNHLQNQLFCFFQQITWNLRINSYKYKVPFSFEKPNSHIDKNLGVGFCKS